MSYVTETLADGERVLYEARLSLWTQAASIGVGAFWLILGFILLFFGGALLPLLTGGLFWASAYLSYAFTEFAVTDCRVVAKFGFFGKRAIELDIGKIESVQVGQGPLGQAFGYGTLAFSGAGNPLVKIPGVKGPMAFRGACMSAIGAARAAPPMA
jgi:membrane protein YdbS with pleckstrin-like domain